MNDKNERITTITSEDLNKPLTEEQKRELQEASLYADKMMKEHPILEQSPLTLRLSHTSVADYLSRFPQEEQEVYKEYYEEEL